MRIRRGGIGIRNTLFTIQKKKDQRGRRRGRCLFFSSREYLFRDLSDYNTRRGLNHWGNDGRAGVRNIDSFGYPTYLQQKGCKRYGVSFLRLLTPTRLGVGPSGTVHIAKQGF